MAACRLWTPGPLAYLEALDYQRQIQQAKILDPSQPDVLILTEHPPVYTLGQGATVDYIKFSPGAFPLHRIERGGEVTYHGPGQLVGYPVLNLRHYRPDLHWYLRQLEEVVILALGEFGIKAQRVPGWTGVWAEGHKLCAIGIKVSRWVTLHGFALNVTTDLAAFEQIIPCGLTAPVGTMQQFCPDITLEAAQTAVIWAFAQVFGVQWELHSQVC